MHSFSKELKRRARASLTGNYRISISAFLIINIAISLLEAIFSMAMGEPITTFQVIVTYLINFLIALVAEVFSAGTIKLNLMLAREQKPGPGVILYGFKNQPDRYILGGLLTIVLMAIAMLPLIGSLLYFYYLDNKLPGMLILIAGTLISIVLAFVLQLNIYLMLYLLVDQTNLTVMEAFKKSVSLMKGKRGKLLYIMLSFLPMSLLALLSFGLGILWVFPYVNQTMTHFYLETVGEPAKGSTIDITVSEQIFS